jgi:hypothetical protein
MVNFSKLFAVSVFAAMTTAVIGQLGEDYCTYSPDADCYVNGKPECCLDDSSECPEEQPPCNVVSSPSPTTPSPTSAPVPLPGADYCTYAPDTGCYMNGKPECCLDDSTDCTEEQPPCDVVNSPSPTPSPTAAPVPLPGADYCTYAPDTGCYMNGKPECCLDDSDCPDQKPPCDVTPPPTPLPSPGLTQPPTPLPTNFPSRRPTLEPTNSPTDRYVNIYKQCLHFDLNARVVSFFSN